VCAVRGPEPSSVLPRLAAHDLDAVGDHERGIKADAELSDKGRVLTVLAEPFQEGAGAGARDRAEVLGKLGVIHADAVVGNDEAAGLLVGLDAYGQPGVVADQ